MAMSWTPVGLPGPRKCNQRIGLHVLSGCDTVSYPSRKGKKSALKLLDIDIPGYDQVFGQPGTTNAQLKATTARFFLLFCGLKSCTTTDDARARVFYGRKMTPPLKLHPTDVIVQLHMLRAV